MGDAATTLRAVPSDAESPATGKSVSRSHLVNRLNYINFQDQTVLVSLKHLVYEDAILLRARPEPCAGERLECRWYEPWGIQQILRTYRFDYLLIADGKKYLVVNSELLSMDDTGLSLLLPPACREFQARRIRRHPASEISAQLLQHGVLFNCALVDFTPVTLRVSGSWDRPEAINWINTEEPVHLKLSRGDEVIFSGTFDILSLHPDIRCCSFVLKQHQNNFRRFRTKTYRNERKELVPSPNIVFDHPLIGRRVNLKMGDISGTGFSIEENEGESLLLPGMMIPGVKISFAQGLTLDCLAQVLSRNVTGGEGEERTVRCGCAVLEMEITDHVKLLSILHQAADRNAYVSTEVDLDDLWNFFFQTGFIYPGKYVHFQANKERIKEIYARLYNESPHIARHFIYLNRGAILGHLAMVRFYRDSWLIHHHAARKSATVKAGLAVLEQVGEYLNELESFPFAHLRYVFCYYRPDNKFPARVFGGFARQYDDQGSCSLDLFAYSHYIPQGEEPPPWPEPWVLALSSDFDLTELNRFYRHVSGGLMIDAFDLYPGAAGSREVNGEYRSLGFRKEIYLYSLRKGGSLKAFFLVNCTDAGFNMAELTNCVTVIVIDEETPAELIELSLRRVSRHYEGEGMPVLTFPNAYVESKSLPREKSYLLWTLDMHYSDHFLQYCDALFNGHAKGR
ncbi:pilus assembly protein PilZ [Geomonas nitrogeniifigens]|uniref:Pilus assembly protein PilZ n=1 Tax=Geomonas diazotrophica TaxID=2843197 RepID=A0ABX8JVA9_9BACT|nr:pilus assembly protein PilZ [Geomonas nitrogeniifigens]QWV99345.1 pilus assembly protein PilZ [Geomonas nitrogeniifigens]QXE88512.1 pilus assembly protein PilZ [Geomonas nitrogeniifigens]